MATRPDEDFRAAAPAAENRVAAGVVLATTETRREMARMVVEDVRRVLSGEKPLRAVIPEPVKR